MANKTIVIGTEKTIKSSSLWLASNDDVFVVAAYGYNSQISDKTQYSIESCTIIDPQTGVVKNPNPFKNITDFEPDYLYPELLRFNIVESSVNEFYNTFPECNLQGSEFAVALTTHISEQMGYSPWVIIQPDEKNLIEFCQNKGWTFTVLGNGKNNVPQQVQEIISNLVSHRNDAENLLILRKE